MGFDEPNLSPESYQTESVGTRKVQTVIVYDCRSVAFLVSETISSSLC
jgi:hypothetical protein